MSNKRVVKTKSHSKSSKSDKRKTVKSVLPVLPVSTKRALAATETETAAIAREFATWAAQQTDKIAIETRKSVVASQLTDRGVSRAATILTRAVEVVSDELGEKHLDAMKKQIDADAEAEKAQRRTPSILAKAKQILQAPNILTEVLAVTEKLGHVGEEQTRSLVFLSAVAGITARTHEDAVHLILKGPSSGGKNAVLKCVFKLLPKGASLILTNTTQLGLIYIGESIPVLVFQEIEGVKGAEFVVRQIMSEGVVQRITATQGLVRTVFKTSVLTTTTRERIHAENETRAFSITVSGDAELTRRVIESEAKTATGAPRPSIDGELLLGWREAISQLLPGEVVVPFANELAKTFPHDRVRARRDFQRTLNLVRTCTLLHQQTRKSDAQGRIIAKPCDYEMVKPILDELYKTVDNPLTIRGKEILTLLGELGAKTKDGWVERVALVAQAEDTGIASASTVQSWCKDFAEGLGLCDVRPNGGRLEYRLKNHKAAA